MTKRRHPYPLRLVSNLIHIPSYITFFEGKIRNQEAEGQRISGELHELTQQVKDLTDTVRNFEKLDDRIMDIQHRLNLQTVSEEPHNHAEKTTVNNTVSDDHRFDQFYKRFEDRFRGSEEVIKERVAEHLPLFTSLPAALKKKPIIDIGCGRGEMLGVLKENGFKGVGIDMNESMVKRAQQMGYEAHYTDASSYLNGLKPGSIAAITGFHIVEHIPFESLMQIFSDCYRTIGRGGFALFETPNPETLSVGAHTFYLDPSHQRPIPPQLLAFMLEYCGFETSIIRLHEMKKIPKALVSTLDKDIHQSIWGPADYAVVARKP